MVAKILKNIEVFLRRRQRPSYDITETISSHTVKLKIVLLVTK